jgi:uncharacterized glyoxalase superfamily protein PhnB
MKLFTQLNFGGNCEEAFRFYEKHLSGKITMMMTQSQAPGAPRTAGNAIIHARMTIGHRENGADRQRRAPKCVQENAQRLSLSFRRLGGRG